MQENSQKMNFWGPVPRYRTPSDGDHNNDDDDDDDDDDDANGEDKEALAALVPASVVMVTAKW